MQPESAAPSTQTSSILPQSPEPIFQYGILSNENLLEDQRGRSEVSNLPGHSLALWNGVGMLDGSQGGEEDVGRLKGIDKSGKRPKASAQLIAEYENAMMPVKQKRSNEGPEFKIVRRKVASPDATNLEDFPNEVLTHILSHLPAASLSAVSLVSRQFYNLVTTPHAWRQAFARFFAGQDSLEESSAPSPVTGCAPSYLEEREQLRSEQRFFTRLTGLASWRSEYVLRTRLLRSLSRGKPSLIAVGHGASSRSISAANNANPVVTYTSQLFSTIDHIHAVFGTGKRSLRFIHGTEETGAACTSDPNIGKVDNWGLSDPQALPQFVDLFPGDQQYGLGQGLMIGVPNAMDVSQPYGMIYGEGFPGGQTYFRSSEEMRGRFLASSEAISDPEAGIPQILGVSEAICAVWITKSNNVPLNTDGLVGMISGSSAGVVTSYSLGADSIGANRITKGEITAKWVLSPGVPIIGIAVDESYSAKRKSNERVWAIALNALGEVFYLTRAPKRPVVDRAPKMTSEALERLAWETGRSVWWQIIEPSRRTARDDPYNNSEISGSYSPRSSSSDMKLSKEQLRQEQHEIEKFLKYMPAHFRKVCSGWDMRRRMEVDFAGDDGRGAGEAVFVIKCGHEENEDAEIKRFMRCRSEEASREVYPLPKTPPIVPNVPTMASLFGGGAVTRIQDSEAYTFSPQGHATPLRKTNASHFVEDWYTSVFSLGSQSHAEIMTSAVDLSTFAVVTTWEDPLLTVGGRTSAFSSIATPTQEAEYALHSIPGHRGRLIAVGTKTGGIILWNMRGSHSENPLIINELHSLRTIYTDSPQISCLAISALYLVHGGNDGLVQIWDPLASTLQPIRTLNSRFASRARRRLVQAEASVEGVGINLYAAGAIIMDPDPTVLRGMVSLGTHLRYWSYSSSAADQYASKKRRLRRSNERGSNSGPDRFTNTGRGALMDYIATEQQDLKIDKERRTREQARLRGRFGVGIGNMSEEEALRYAEMVSQETFLKEDEERKMASSSPIDPLESSSSILNRTAWGSSTSTPEESATGYGTKITKASKSRYKSKDEFEYDIEEAIRLSLMDGIDDGGRSPKTLGAGQYDFAITYKSKSKNSRDGSASSSSNGSVFAGNKISRKQRRAQSSAMSNNDVRPDDLELALRLSLMEVQGRGEVDEEESEDIIADGEQDEFPSLEMRDLTGKGKGRAS